VFVPVEQKGGCEVADDGRVYLLAPALEEGRFSFKCERILVRLAICYQNLSKLFDSAAGRLGHEGDEPVIIRLCEFV
jgi:hypothetical protein